MSKYVAIDIETTGLDPHTCDIVQFSAVVDDFKNPLPLEKLPVYNAYIVNEFYVGEPYALGMHPAIFKKIAAVWKKFPTEPMQIEGDWYLGIADLMTSFAAFLDRSGIEPNAWGTYQINVAGKNVGAFDLPFIKAKIGPNWGKVAMKHRTLDPGILYYNPMTDLQVPDLKTCMERAGITGEVAHTGVEDSMAVIQLLRKKFLH